MRTALLFALLPSLVLLAGCDAGAPEAPVAETAVASPSWTAAADQPALDLVFSTLTTYSGGVIRAMLERSDAPGDSRLTLSSAHQPSSDQHHIALEAQGLEVKEAELLIRRIQDKEFVSVTSSKDISEITGQVDRDPQSFHYQEITDDRGDTYWIIHYDYADSGGRFQSDFTDGEIEVQDVGYRVQLQRHEGGFSQLRIDGYDQMAIKSMQALTAPEVRARVHEMLPTRETD